MCTHITHTVRRPSKYVQCFLGEILGAPQVVHYFCNEGKMTNLDGHDTVYSETIQ